jgi:DNA-binding MarR family transcriptional regulator
MQEKRVCIEIRTTANTMGTYINARLHGVALCDTTMLHGRIIKYLCEKEDQDVFQRDIESLLDIRRSTATTILKCMEKNGLITRTSVSSDARLKKLCLTDKARGLHEQIADEFESVEALARCGLGQQELDCFFDVLEKIRHNFAGARGEERL